MFQYTFDRSMFERLERISRAANIPLLVLCEVAFMVGLNTLERLEIQDVVALTWKTVEALGAQKAFIVNNWRTMSDNDMAKRLGVRPSFVHAVRTELLLFRNAGRPRKSEKSSKSRKKERCVA